MRAEELDTPVMLVDLDLLEANIGNLMSRLHGSGVRVRPHLKTAKCAEVAYMLKAAGVQGFCVAKLSEAEALVAAGIDDLLITSEIAGAPKLSRLALLHRRYPGVKIVVDSLPGARALHVACAGAHTPLEVLIEVNVGQNRCGVLPGAPVLALARDITGLPNLRLVGLQGYEGHLQRIVDPDEKAQRVHETMAQLVASADLLRAEGFAVETVTTGGTGTCELCAAYPGISEVQPGSFVFLDTAYRNVLGPSSGYANALTILATVISRPASQRAVVDAGLKALSTDQGNPEPRDLPGVHYRPGGDEHGILEWDEGSPVYLPIGERVALTPSHIDTTVNLHELYHVYRGERLVDRWPVLTRGKIQ